MDDRDQLEVALAAGQERTPTASPSVPYIKYIMEDEFKPDNLPPNLKAVIYDKELALSNLHDPEIMWVRMAIQRAEIAFKNGRPALAGSHQEEVMLSALPVKLLIKLSRSREGFERRQQTTQTVIKQAVISGAGGRAQKRRWSLFGRKGGSQ